MFWFNSILLPSSYIIAAVSIRGFLCYLFHNLLFQNSYAKFVSPGIQVLNFWRPDLLEKWQKAQISCISPFLCWKTNDTIILSEVNRIRKKLWTLLQFSSCPQGPISETINTISGEFNLLQVKLWHHMFSSMKKEEDM